MMGGRIWLESQEGTGSVFHFTARFRRGPQEPLNLARHSTAIAGKRVLAVDDNSTSLHILEELTRQWGMRSATANSGPEAMQLLRIAQREADPFHLVVSDVNMPGMDGYQLTSRIRSDARLRGIQVVLLTSGEHPEDVSTCGQLKVAAHLMKPVKQSELFEAIVRALAAPFSGIQESEVVLNAASTCGPLRVLLAEDSLVNQKLAIGLLEKAGHHVEVVEDGEQVVERFQSDHFDVILMDIQMPRLDGLQATAAIRELEAGRDTRVPIVAMTAHALKGDRERFLAAGMDAYLAKPMRAAELYETLVRVTAHAKPVTGEGITR
jgi:CheY-like chemotaxis protein